MTAYVWRGIDAPRMEIAHVESLHRARGTQIGLFYELQWKLTDDLLRVEVVGGPSRVVELGDADFFDVLNSPFFNSLPVLRDGLLTRGPAREYVVRFVRVPALTDERSHQRYTPLGERVVRYRAADFEADIEFDREGFVTLYHGYLERVVA